MNPSSLVNLPPELARRSGSHAVVSPQGTRQERLWAAGVFGVAMLLLAAKLLF